MHKRDNKIIPDVMIFFDQLNWMRSYSRFVFMATILFVLVVWSIFFDAVPLVSLSLWSGVVLLLTLVVEYYMGRIDPEVDQSTKARKHLGLVVAMFTLGGSWGLGGYLLFVPESLGHQLLLVFILGCVITVASAVLAAFKRMVYAFMVPTLLPITLLLLFGGEDFQSNVVILLCCIATAQLIIVSRFHTVLEESLAIRAENGDLISDLMIAKKLAEASSKAKGDFLAVMSHELRTPLNSVIGFSGLLLKNRHQHLDEKELTLAKRISESGKNLLGLINDILDLSKLDSHRMQADSEAVNLSALIKEVVEQLKGQLGNKPLDLRTDLPRHDIMVTSDAGKLRQILVNLIGNAIKFTSEGRVTVRLLVNSAGAAQRIEVVDTGIGLSEAQIKIIFKPFDQADRSVSRKYGGTGLGLSISKSLADLLGFSLGVTGVEGEGSTFSLSFCDTDSHAADLVEVIEGDDGAEAEGLLKGLRGKHLLLVNADQSTGKMFSVYLKGTGSRLSIVEPDNSALTVAIAEQPELIIIDLQSSPVSGWELLLRMRNSPNLCNIPVLVVSEPEASEGLAHGSIGLLTVPFNPEKLIHAVYDALMLRRRAYIPQVLMIGDNHEVISEVVSAFEVERTNIKIMSEVNVDIFKVSGLKYDLVVIDMHLFSSLDIVKREDLVGQLVKKDRSFALLFDDVSLAEHLEAMNTEVNLEKRGVFLRSDDFQYQLKTMIRKACQNRLATK